MGHYTTYCGRIKLAKHTPTIVWETLKALETQGSEFKPSPEHKHPFFHHPDCGQVFSNFGRAVGLFDSFVRRDYTGKTSELVFCANSKAGDVIYGLLLDWLLPCIANTPNDLMFVWIRDEHYHDTENDKVHETQYVWTAMRFGFEPKLLSTVADPWEVEPAFFDGFLRKD